jgi:hypothetical protein
MILEELIFEVTSWAIDISGKLENYLRQNSRRYTILTKNKNLFYFSSAVIRGKIIRMACQRTIKDLMIFQGSIYKGPSIQIRNIPYAATAKKCPISVNGSGIILV